MPGGLPRRAGHGVPNVSREGGVCSLLLVLVGVWVLRFMMNVSILERPRAGIEDTEVGLAASACLVLLGIDSLFFPLLGLSLP